MRKKGLMHLHSLLVLSAQTLDEEHGTEIRLEKYEDVDIKGPRDLRAQKNEQKEAVMALLDDITTSIEMADESQDMDATTEHAIVND